MKSKDVRWVQRFSNYKKALQKLQNAKEQYDGEDDEDVLEVLQVGIIKYFEMVYELAWNTMKDYYEEQGETNIQGSKDAIKLAFKRGVVTEGEKWFDMVNSRRLSVHTYDEDTANKVSANILNVYINLFVQLQSRLNIELFG